MTLTESLKMLWRKAAPVAARPHVTLPLERHAPGVPSEYLSLYTYLERRYASVVVLTFEQMEALLGFPLPAPASTDGEWWTAASPAADSHAAAWVRAGRTATPTLLARTVLFERLL